MTIANATIEVSLFIKKEECNMTTVQQDYVEDAFTAIHVISTEEDTRRDIADFIQRWGGIDPLTFAHVLQHAEGLDQVIAAFALGYTGSTWAKELLLPFLHSSNPQLRWAVALSLGEMQEKQALPVLIDMLQEYLPPPPSPLAEYDWFEMKHIHVANLLGRWRDSSTISVLRSTLERVWQLEQASPHPRATFYWDYQEALAYALGQLGSFDALTNMALPPARLRYWTMHMAMGYLNAEHQYRNVAKSILQDMHYDGTYKELGKLLLHVLQEKVGLSSQEANFFLQSFNDDHAGIWYS